MANKIWVKSNHETRANDPSHTAFYQVEQVEGQNSGRDVLVPGGAVVEIEDTPAAQAALKDKLIRKATDKEVAEARKEQRQDAAEAVASP